MQWMGIRALRKNEKVEESRGLMKSAHIALNMNKEVLCAGGEMTLKGYVFCFKKKMAAQFEEIINNLFN